MSGLQEYRRAVFVSHVNPDPDSLATMLSLAYLVEQKTNLSTLITRDGPISRAENRTMVDVLNIDLTLIEDVEWHEDDAIIMVDSQPNTGRHTFTAPIDFYCVIDHHNTPGDLSRVRMSDIRPNVGATSTLATNYLIEQGVPITEKLATALLYAIESEVTGFPREANRADDKVIDLLSPLADKDALAQIRSARLPHSHFECLLQALQSSFIYDRLILSWVDDLPQPEQAAEVVDFMVRFEKIDWAVCAGVYKDMLIISVRSALPNA
ncbi:MAG: DHH family phosphoesterase, partial [Gemmataceae bacterium]